MNPANRMYVHRSTGGVFRVGLRSAGESGPAKYQDNITPDAVAAILKDRPGLTFVCVNEDGQSADATFPEIKAAAELIGIYVTDGVDGCMLCGGSGVTPDKAPCDCRVPLSADALE